MKSLAIVAAMIVTGLVVTPSAQAHPRSVHVVQYGYGHAQPSYGYGHGHTHQFGGYTQRWSGYGGGYGAGYGGGYGIGYEGYRAPVYHDTSHYDYHPTRVVPHGNHYDVIPGHYHYHRTGHWHH
jgi:hypothetical protein